MKQIGKCIGSGLALFFLSLILIIGVSRASLSSLPTDTLPLLLGSGVLASILIYFRTILIGVFVTLLISLLLIGRQYLPNIENLQIIPCLLAVASGEIFISHTGLSFAILIVLSLFQLYMGSLWQIGIYAFLAAATVGSNLFAPHLKEYYYHLSQSLGRQARGLIIFLFSYGMAIMVFAVLYGCLDAWKGPNSLDFEWISGRPHFGHYILLSLMAISRNPVAVQPKNSAAFTLLSLESLVGVFLFAIVLRELLIITGNLDEKQSKR